MKRRPMFGDRVVPWLNDLPANWEFAPLKYCASINKEDLPESTRPNFEFHYIDIGNVSSEGRILGTELIKFENAPSRARRVVRRGDILVSTVRTYLKAIAHVEDFPGNLICSTGFAVVTANASHVARFLFYWIRSNYFVDEVVARSTGVSYPAINASDLGSLPVPLIPNGLQQSIAGFLDHKTRAVDEAVALRERQVEVLKRQRQAIITAAVTGQLTIPKEAR